MYRDNNPLTYILSSAKLYATGHRWASALAGFNFDIKYRAGHKDKDADAMSRLPTNNQEEKYHEISNSAVKAISCQNNTITYIAVVPSCNIDLVQVTVDTGVPSAQIEIGEIRKYRRTEPIIERWRRAVKHGFLQNRDRCCTKEDMFMRKQFLSFTMRRGILYRECKKTI